jgi:hypothetical protein
MAKKNTCHKFICQHVETPTSIPWKLCRRVAVRFYVRYSGHANKTVSILRYRCEKHKFPKSYNWFTEITYDEALVLDVMTQ